MGSQVVSSTKTAVDISNYSLACCLEMEKSLVGDGVLDVPRGTISFFAGMLGEFVTFHCRDVREAVPYKEIRNRAKNTNLTIFPIIPHNSPYAKGLIFPLVLRRVLM